ncbi:MAG: glucose-1-phosphate thymidylyltransferase [Chloroflexota bacterium]|nr:glucose-1-phosphate thymidylyltransferase [Dehalococcoidia bacterium]MDW8252888.1 glucose-1-phosphate thymidylyltransferase [Chloroflexota bacterium]
MKGLILSGGKGTRLRPLTYTGAKQLVPVANKPVLFYAIENLVSAGITDLGIVVGDTREQIIAAVGDGSKFGASVCYIQQDAPRGLAHGVKIARHFLGNDRFVLFLGDNFLREGIRPFVERFRRGTANAQILLSRVPDPRNFGVAELDGTRVIRLVEKPKHPPSDLALVGIYFFDQTVFEAVEAIRPSFRGELEITDAIQWLVDAGLQVDAEILTTPWIDTGKMEDMLEANRLVLETLEGSVEGEVDAASRLVGKVIIARGARIINSHLRGPVIVGENCEIVNSFIGPFSAIDHDCRIVNSEIEHSIVLEHAIIENFPTRIEDSLIGRFAEVRHAQAKPVATRLLLGDHSRVGIP